MNNLSSLYLFINALTGLYAELLFCIYISIIDLGLVPGVWHFFPNIVTFCSFCVYSLVPGVWHPVFAEQVSLIHAVLQHLLEAILYCCNILIVGHAIPCIISLQNRLQLFDSFSKAAADTGCHDK